MNGDESAANINRSLDEEDEDDAPGQSRGRLSRSSRNMQDLFHPDANSQVIVERQESLEDIQRMNAEYMGSLPLKEMKSADK